MAQLASQTEITSFMHSSPSVNVFQSAHMPTCMYATDTCRVPLGSGRIVGDGEAVAEAEIPQHLDYISRASFCVKFPAVLNCTSAAADLGGSTTNANSTVAVRGYYGGFGEGSEGDHEVVGYATSTGATTANVFTCTVPAAVQEGDYYVAYPIDGITGTVDHTDAAVTAAADFAALILALAGAPTVTYVHDAGFQPVHGRVGAIAGALTSFSDRSISTDLGTNAACNYRVIFSRDRKHLNAVGDSSIMVPETDADVKYTRFIANGPNIPALSNNKGCPAAGLKSDIAAYWNSYATADLVNSISLMFDGVCADAVNGDNMKIYAEFFMPDNERCEERLGCSSDPRVLKHRSAHGPQEVEMPIPLGFFTSRGRSLNMSQHQYTPVSLLFRLNPWTHAIRNLCGISGAPQTFTSDNALGTVGATLITKKGNQQNSHSPFYPSTAAPTVSGLNNLDASSIEISVRFQGHYLQPEARDRYAAMTQKIAVPTHAMSETRTIRSAAPQTVPVAGNNVLSATIVLIQAQSRLNQGFRDYMGPPISGSDKAGGNYAHRHTLKSAKFQAGAKRRTETFGAQALHNHAGSHGATSRHSASGMYCHAFTNSNPYGPIAEAGLNLQRIPNFNAHIELEPFLFQNNSPDGGLDAQTTAAGAASSAIAGGERYLLKLASIVQNVYEYDPKAGQGRFLYPN